MPIFLLVFIDGIGLGRDDDSNPFWLLDLKGFQQLAGDQKWCVSSTEIDSVGLQFRGIDACLDQPGLPQSGTGQATLFTGINCAKLAGRHYGPYPHSSTLAVIADKNIFSQVQAQGMHVAFANAYPPLFFEKARERNRWSVTTRSCLDAGVWIRTMDDLAAGTAIAADLTGRGLRDYLDLDVTVVDEAVSAERLASLASKNAFTAFEYFLTDRAGHRMSHKKAEELLMSLDRFMMTLMAHAQALGVTVLVTSDHGNLEDLTVRTHTLNPVPFVASGPHAGNFAGVRSLTDIVPAILSSYSV